MNQDFKNTFTKLNDKLITLDERIELVIVGGAAFILKKIIKRATHDIDYINIVKKEIKFVLNKLNINDRAKLFENNFGDWKKDKVILYEFSNLKVYTLSIERLLVSRLFNRKRSEDLVKGFKNKNIEINQEKFESIFMEVYGYCDPNYINELKENIYLIKVIYKERGWDENNEIRNICEKITS